MKPTSLACACHVGPTIQALQNHNPWQLRFLPIVACWKAFDCWMGPNSVLEIVNQLHVERAPKEEHAKQQMHICCAVIVQDLSPGQA